ADTHTLIRACDAVRRGFEEQFRAVSGVDAVVKISPARRFRFLHSRRPAAEIGHARRPDLLPANRRERVGFGREVRQQRGPAGHAGENPLVVTSIDQHIPIGIRELIVFSPFFERGAVFGFVELHRADGVSVLRAVASVYSLTNRVRKRRSLPLAALTQSSPRLNCSTAYSLARIESARIVSVGLTHPLDTKQLPSTTNRFLMSWDWFHLLSTDVFGSSPIRAVPTSWMLWPGGNISRFSVINSIPAA